MRTLASALVALTLATAARAADAPNVLLVITDDQGFGDLGAHGNPVIRTPNLDAFTRQSAWLKNFYVSPVCSPTRSSLLTGLYNYRTGIVDTSTGRSMMRPDVTTLPLLMFNASMGGNYQIASITALLLLLPSIAFMLVVERFLKANVLAMVGR